MVQLVKYLNLNLRQFLMDYLSQNIETIVGQFWAILDDFWAILGQFQQTNQKSTEVDQPQIDPA